MCDADVSTTRQTQFHFTQYDTGNIQKYRVLTVFFISSVEVSKWQNTYKQSQEVKNVLRARLQNRSEQNKTKHLELLAIID